MISTDFSRGFGDDKFVPEVSREKLAAVAEDVLGKDELDFYAEHCFPRMFEYCNEVRQLGVFPPRGITTYFSANCTEEDGKLVTAFLISKVLTQVDRFTRYLSPVESKKLPIQNDFWPPN